jgi:hypothetical protein
MKDFDGDVAVQDGVIVSIDFTYCTPVELRNDFVFSERFSS